jgi:bifunctional enzyme CysN/CysC
MSETALLSTAPASANAYLEMDLLRFSTAGSVDDGKSTLIGRLLYDTKSIFQDQMEQIEGASRRLGEEEVNLALLTDGLRAEREQKITIDVAYRYFATPKRKFIIADTPGHVQYTRNMVTGASTAELAIVLVDARKGVLTQSKRHAFISSLLQIPHIVVAVNKMDLVDYSEEVYQRIVDEYREFAEKLDVSNITFIPMSALRGDNVVEKGDRMPWYDGGTLLHHLETVNVAGVRNLTDFRFPVQYVIRPHQDYRGFAGRIVSGTVSPGEEVVVLPGGQSTRVLSVDSADGELGEGAAGDSVVLRMEDEIDISRGDMIVRKRNVPSVSTRLDATICWMGEATLDRSVPYVLIHTSRQVSAYVSELVYRIDVDTLHRDEVDTLGLNDIGRVEITTSQPVFFDSYAQNHATGSFILVDPYSHVTVAAGMIRGEVRAAPKPKEGEGRATSSQVRLVSPDVVWEESSVTLAEREERQGHAGAVVWFTGMSGAGKSTIARALERELFDEGAQVTVLDGDRLRHGLCGDLGFSDADRSENIRRVGELAKLLYEQGHVVLCTFVSPFRADRERVRALLPEGRFLEVHVTADLDTLTERDTKGLYARARRGEVENLTGVSSPYEAPVSAELEIDTTDVPVPETVARIRASLSAAGVLRIEPNRT